MTHLAPTAVAVVAPVVADEARATDERLPIGQSALIIAALSLGLWGGIGLAIRWLFG